jgi:hypothetical protein
MNGPSRSETVAIRARAVGASVQDHLPTIHRLRETIRALGDYPSAIRRSVATRQVSRYAYVA